MSVQLRVFMVRAAIVWSVWMCFPQFGTAQQKRVYIANDEHTDYIWTSDEAGYRTAWLNMLDYYLDQADRTDTAFSDYQGRFSADGHFWIWTYEKNRSSAQFQRLIDRIRDGHITIPLQTLVLTYGGMPAEAVLRSMYYAGRIERKYDLHFELVSAMENQTLPFGVISLWAGAGAKYSWKGVCGCGTQVSGLDNRGRELYRAVGPDGRSLLMKWHSLSGTYASGGYAETRDPSAAVSFATSNTTFLSRYPYSAVVGMFGKGGDDLQTMTDQLITAARTLSSPSLRVIVSNEVDFFHDFEKSAPAGSIPTFSGGFGNEWDLYSATMAEVTASVKRSIEGLRSAEAMATLVSQVDPLFMDTRAASADSAFNAMGLYYEHDWTADGPFSGGRPAYQRRLAAQINSYVMTLRRDASARLAQYIKSESGALRFYAFNPLGWVRTDVADIPADISGAFRVIDVSTGEEVRSQRIQTAQGTALRILAEHVPSLGYKVYEIQNLSSAFSDSAARLSNGSMTMENDIYRLTLNGRGAIASLIDKRDSQRELVRQVGGLLMNDQGTGGGTAVAENVGPVSASIFVNAGGSPSHSARITMYNTVDRIDIENEITSNFGDNIVTFGFGFNLDGFTVRHEEVGAVATAKPIGQGGSYSDNLGRYDYLTMNHFVDLSTGERGVTLSNWDSPFFRLGNSSGTTLDAGTPQIRALVGGRIDQGFGIANQNADTYFRNRYALQRHGTYDQAGAMRMALEHQNPLVTSYLGSGSGPFPGTSYSLLSVSDTSVLLWGVKPAEEGISGGIIVRLWNLDQNAHTATLTLQGSNLLSGWRTTHIETNLGSLASTGSSITDQLPAQWLQTYRMVIDFAVPTQISSFTADPDNHGGVIVQWTTLSETNNYGFEVQKSLTSSGNFATIANSFVAGHGTTDIPQTYTFVDLEVTPGVWYYRLRQVDLYGSEWFSDPVRVELTTGVNEGEIPTRFVLDQNYPNPFNPNTMIRFGVPRRARVELTVFNALGEQIAALVNGEKAPGYYELRFNAARLSSGMYIYRLRAGEYVATKRMILMK